MPDSNFDIIANWEYVKDMAKVYCIDLYLVNNSTAKKYSLNWKNRESQGVLRTFSSLAEVEAFIMAIQVHGSGDMPA